MIFLLAKGAPHEVYPTALARGLFVRWLPHGSECKALVPNEYERTVIDWFNENFNDSPHKPGTLLFYTSTLEG